MVAPAMLLALLQGGTAAAETINFNYGWRFLYEGPEAAGPDNATCSQATWTALEPNATCVGMERNPNRFNYTDCATACCYNPSCMSWQMAVHTGGSFVHGHDRECLHGYAGVAIHCSVDAEAPSFMIGGKRAAVPSPLLKTDYAYASPSFSDNEWRRVDAPHDFVSEQGFSEDADSHRGYAPRGVGWYRKRFTAPKAEPSAETLQLHFEGVFHHAEVYLNGALLQVHTAGYTGFTVRLDNATSLKAGAANVIAVRADASYGSGHWYEGGGIYRSVHLVRLPKQHFVEHGVFVVPEVAVSEAGSVAGSITGLHLK